MAVRVPFERITGLPVKAQTEIQRNFDEVLRNLGAGGVLLVDPNGGGDYTTLKAALDFVVGATGYWTIYVRGQTTEVWGSGGGTKTYSGLNVAIIGVGQDSKVTITGTSAAIFTGGSDIRIEGLTLYNNGGTLLFTNSGTYATNSIFQSTSGVNFDTGHITNCGLSAPSVNFVEIEMVGGTISTDNLYFGAVNTSICLGVQYGSYSGSTMSVTSDQSTLISGVLACYMTLGGAFGSYTFNFVDSDAVGSATTYRLTLAAKRSVGHISASYGAGSKLIEITGTSNRVWTGGLGLATNSGGATNSLNGSGISPSGAAGGDLSGTYPNPSVVDDSHSHTAATLPASMPPSGAAGGDLSGTYPNPSVVDDSHSHTAATLPASMPPSGAAGGDLSGTYPNPSVVDDSHAHTASTLPSTMPPRKTTATIGDGASTAIDVTHGWTTFDVQVQVYDASTGETVYPTITRPTNAKVTITFSVAPAVNAYKVVVFG